MQVINFARPYMEKHMSTTQPSAPDFIQPRNLSDMSDDEIELLLEGIRVRRMSAKVLHDETIAIRDQARKLNLATGIEKKLEKLAKAIAAVDKHLDKLTAAANEVRQMRIALGATAL